MNTTTPNPQRQHSKLYWFWWNHVWHWIGYVYLIAFAPIWLPPFVLSWIVYYFAEGRHNDP